MELIPLIEYDRFTIYSILTPTFGLLWKISFKQNIPHQNNSGIRPFQRSKLFIDFLDLLKYAIKVPRRIFKFNGLLGPDEADPFLAAI